MTAPRKAAISSLWTTAWAAAFLVSFAPSAAVVLYVVGLAIVHTRG